MENVNGLYQFKKNQINKKIRESKPSFYRVSKDVSIVDVFCIFPKQGFTYFDTENRMEVLAIYDKNLGLPSDGDLINDQIN